MASTATARRPRYIPVVATVETLATHRLVFDSRTCGKCMGAKYLEGFGGIDGGRCWGCSATGRVLTREGKAAQRRYLDAREALTVSVAALEVGDRVEETDVAGRRRWATVTELEVRDVAVPLASSRSMLGAGLPEDAVLDGERVYYTPLAGHPDHRESDRLGHPYPWAAYTRRVTMRTARANVITTGAGTAVRYDAELMAAAWSAALAKRGAELVEREA